MLKPYLHESRIAYFSMEIALKNEIHTYAGGLGVLAGDTIRTAADLKIPMVAVTLISKQGYFHQSIDINGNQQETADPWDPTLYAKPLDAMVAVELQGRQVWIRAWLYELHSHLGSQQPVILLDTDLAENDQSDRYLTHYLYGGDEAYRLKQETILGMGGVRMLRALGFSIRQYHMNEGHSALLSLELLQECAYAEEDIRPGEALYDIPKVRDMCCFTTHTPVEAGHDRFPYQLVQCTLGSEIDYNVLKQYAGVESLNMTRLALNLSEYVNGVAKRHAEVSRRMFPGYRVHAVTNGVHPFTWTHPNFQRIYDNVTPGWCFEPQLLRSIVHCVSDNTLWEAHIQCKQALINQLKVLTNREFNLNVPILGFARRMTAYKRLDLLFSDFDRLSKIAEKYPFQVVIAGKAHPKDHHGKKTIEMIHRYIEQFAGKIPMAFIPNYDMTVALSLVSGSDVWLNTPLKPLEASGTSGMKAAFNGVPSLSVLDGWWIEGCLEGVTGWAIGNSNENENGRDADSLYQKLEEIILPLWHNDKAAWAKLMKSCISMNATYFNSHRMMLRYVSESYIR